MHEIWDFPNPTQITGQREVTTVPSQSLFMMNSRLVVSTANSVASRLLDDENLRRDEDRFRVAFRLIYSRLPSSDEIAASAEMMASLETPSDEARPELYRWTALIQSLLSSAEFRYAW
jgi:hypothetical protein